eukprot:TRINITY_DN8929_c0_g1_i1.p1 TRINITY_DN8929_c0_g1~~TRINITY_DN8929_c0_g1_i1.p1  ORF type:complete len:291 (+),score=94.45 TRINITY_DN8929_c0_g1_i1:704-1576(+)
MKKDSSTPIESISEVLLTLYKASQCTDESILSDICWTVASISIGSEERKWAIIESGICRKIVELLMHPSFRVKKPALRAVGSLLTGNEEQAQSLLNLSVLPCLLSLLNSSNKELVQDACWAISNVTAGNRHQIDKVFISGIMPRLLEIAYSGSFKEKLEATWAITNAVTFGSIDNVRELCESGLLAVLTQLLIESHDIQLLDISLNITKGALEFGKTFYSSIDNPIAAAFEDLGGVNATEALMNHENEDIAAKSQSIVDDYLTLDEMQTEEICEAKVFDVPDSVMKMFDS